MDQLRIEELAVIRGGDGEGNCCSYGELGGSDVGQVQNMFIVELEGLSA